MTTLLDGIALEAVYAQKMFALGVDFTWHNSHGESNGAEDFWVGSKKVRLDCKGSVTYYGTGWLTECAVDGDHQDTWYGTNDFKVISYPRVLETMKMKRLRNGVVGWVFEGETLLEEWALSEIVS